MDASMSKSHIMRDVKQLARDLILKKSEELRDRIEDLFGKHFAFDVMASVLHRLQTM